MRRSYFQFTIGKTLMTAVVIAAAGLVFSACKSSGGNTKSDKEYVLSCEAGKAMVSRFNSKKIRMERGPVDISETKKTCSDAEKFSAYQIKRLPRSGEWEFYFPKDGKTVRMRGPYVKNKREGLFKFYNLDGERNRTIVYKGDKKEGPEIHYYVGSDVWRKRGRNSNNQKTGIWETKKNKAGDCITKGPYVKNKRSGEWQECGLASGKRVYVSFRGGYKDDLRHGPATIFHPDGKTLGKGSYYADTACLKKTGDKNKCGKRDGQWVIYYPSGKLAMQGAYSRTTGFRSGNWVEYYQSGEKMGQGERRHTRYGSWQFWDKSGTLLGNLYFSGNDVKIVKGTIYRNGRKVAESRPRRGREDEGTLLLGLLKYSPKNDNITIIASKKMGRWAIFHANGNKKGEGGFSADRPVGAWTYYDESGRKIAEGTLSFAGKRTGVWRELKNGSWVTTEYDFFGRPKR